MLNKALVAFALMAWLMLLSACRAAPETPIITPTIAVTMLPRPTSTQVPVPILSPQWLVVEPISHVILFSSANPLPLTNAGSVLTAKPQLQGAQLWGVSPDGSRARRFTTNEGGIGWRVTSTHPTQAVFLSPEKWVFANPYVQQIALPEDCLHPPQKTDRKWLACHQFQFSPDERWVTFRWGEVYGCSADGEFAFLNLATNKTIIFDSSYGLIRFLPDEQALLMHSYCEAGDVSLFNPETDTETFLGNAGRTTFNSDNTAFVERVTPYASALSYVWGYNLQTHQVFLTKGSEFALWAPDNSHLIFEQSKISGVFEARRIESVDITSGETRTLASDLNFDFHLCASRNSQEENCVWQGDWLQIRRVPYHFWKYEFEKYDANFDCAVWGDDCPDPVSLFALNWRTGELVPWEQAPLPTATLIPEPTATPAPGPDLNSPPIYVEPSSAYAFYVGLDGHSLWLVPANGAPELWVTEGEDFVYVP